MQTNVGKRILSNQNSIGCHICAHLRSFGFVLSWFLFPLHCLSSHFLYRTSSLQQFTKTHASTTCVPHSCPPPSFVRLVCPAPHFVLALASRTVAATHFVHCSRFC